MRAKLPSSKQISLSLIPADAEAMSCDGPLCTHSVDTVLRPAYSLIACLLERNHTGSLHAKRDGLAQLPRKVVRLSGSFFGAGFQADDDL